VVWLEGALVVEMMAPSTAEAVLSRLQSEFYCRRPRLLAFIEDLLSPAYMSEENVDPQDGASLCVQVSANSRPSRSPVVPRWTGNGRL
jgi:hypothetical protein